jgi:hypothetical protein
MGIAKKERKSGRQDSLAKKILSTLFNQCSLWISTTMQRVTVRKSKQCLPGLFLTIPIFSSFKKKNKMFTSSSGHNLCYKDTCQ